MKTFEYTITDEAGLHARPAGMLVSKVKSSGLEVCVSKDGKTANASRLMALMGLGARKGDTVTVTVTGGGEDAAALELEDFFRANL